MSYTPNPQESFRSLCRADVIRNSRKAIDDCVRELYFAKLDDTDDGIDMTSKQLKDVQNAVRGCNCYGVDLDDPYEVINQMRGVAIVYRMNPEIDDKVAGLIDRLAVKAADKIDEIMNDVKERELYYASLKTA